jgi:hypothetical protein
MFTLMAALVLLAAGLPLVAIPQRLEKGIREFPRHRMAGIVLMVLGGGWFILKITQLGQSDFGDYKHILAILFLATLVGSIFYVRDFLAVRGLAILILLCCNVGLKSAFGYYEIPERLVLVTLIYLFIVASLILGIMPYLMRDWINWIYSNVKRVRILGGVFTAMGISLVIAALLY